MDTTLYAVWEGRWFTLKLDNNPFIGFNSKYDEESYYKSGELTNPETKYDSYSKIPHEANSVIKENPSFIKAPNGIVFDGYWDSPDYHTDGSAKQYFNKDKEEENNDKW